MAARVIVVADPKMLPALASGLREGGRLDVATAANPEAALVCLTEPAAAVVFFYGTAEWTLPAALAALEPARRSGVQLIAVLQRAQAAMRDDCFRAGASDAFFMPLPKDQFTARVADLIALGYREEPGLDAVVEASSRTRASPLAPATITSSGVHGAAALEFAAGQTVRLSWKAGEQSFAAWGLVVRASPAAVRFAGLTPEEESRLRSSLKSAAPAEEAPARVATPPGGSSIAPVLTPAAVARLEGAAPPAPAEAPAVAAVAAPAPAAAPAVPLDSLANLFDDAAGPGAPAAQPSPAAAAPAPPEEAAAQPVAELSLGAPWPEIWPLEWCRGAAVALLRNQYAPTGPAEGAAVARKVVDRMPSAERERADPAAVPPALPPAVASLDSPTLDAIVARIALAGAQHTADKLAQKNAPVLVDGAAVAALIKLADAAGERLQQEANGAIAKGDAELLRTVAASRSALTQELLSFKNAVDRLRGLGAAPTLGPGGLDPEVQVGRRPPPPRKPTPATAESVRKDEFATFAATQAPVRARRSGLWLAVASAVFVLSAANALYFSRPHTRALSAAQLERAGPGVLHIAITEKKAVVALHTSWADQADPTALAQLLAELKVEKAFLTWPDGRALGFLEPASGKLTLLQRRKASPPGAAAAATTTAAVKSAEPRGEGSAQKATARDAAAHNPK